MSDKSIIVENISKRYRIGLLESKSDTFAGALFNYIKYPINNFKRLRSLTSFRDTNNNEETILWALRDVNFEVKDGEILGVIGQNGAGKSTLLKVLSRITFPTEGIAKINGRVSSLLEVGTGFHPELTGRENVYLNGTILGMSKKEIDEKFDEIVDFSGIEKFIDTPVKRYSSGMAVRLAFSVGANLNSEIMIIDEVLAVGDTNFQRKCLGRMQEIGNEGKTVLFVSHNLSSISRLCSRTLLFDKGVIVKDGNTEEVLNYYLKSGLGTCPQKTWNDIDAPGNEIVKLKGVRVLSEEGNVIDSLDIRKPISIEMEYEVLNSGHVLVPNYHFYNSEGLCIFVAIENDKSWINKIRSTGTYKSSVTIPGNYLSEGLVLVGAAIATLNPERVHFYEKDIVAFNVLDSLEGDSARGDYIGNMPGVVRPIFEWSSEYQQKHQNK